MTLPLIPEDKANHFLYGALAFLVIYWLSDPWMAVFGCIVVAVGKELWDLLTGKGNSEVADFVWTIVGSLTVFLGVMKNAIFQAVLSSF
jgi:hypothetical protein